VRDLGARTTKRLCSVLVYRATGQKVEPSEKNRPNQDQLPVPIVLVLQLAGKLQRWAPHVGSSAFSARCVERKQASDLGLYNNGQTVPQEMNVRILDILHKSRGR
jgi:hypothetical protein